MVLLNSSEYLSCRLNSFRKEDLVDLATKLGVALKASDPKPELIVSLSMVPSVSASVDCYIRARYQTTSEERKLQLSDAALLGELNKVTEFKWGAVQGELDRRIQEEYVRVYLELDKLQKAIESSLHKDVTNYTICAWYNHWTTVLIEDYVFNHPRVIPSLSRKTKGLDLFFDSQPFDLKVTYLPKEYDPDEAINNPRGLIRWLYENQGEQRFGADNRFFIVLLNPEEPEDSWKLKRDAQLLFPQILQFLDHETVTNKDQITFTYKKRGTYYPHAKLLLITP